MRMVLISFAVLFAVGASAVHADREDPAPLVGADADEHGCRASAGYVWCPRTAQCERPWELAQSEGFENSAEAFRAFCEQD